MYANHPPQTTKLSDFLDHAVVEELWKNNYSLIDYEIDGFEHTIQVEVEDGCYSIVQSDFELSNQDKNKVFDMVQDFIEENTETISDYDPREHDPYRGAWPHRSR